MKGICLTPSCEKSSQQVWERRVSLLKKCPGYSFPPFLKSHKNQNHSFFNPKTNTSQSSPFRFWWKSLKVLRSTRFEIDRNQDLKHFCVFSNYHDSHARKGVKTFSKEHSRYGNNLPVESSIKIKPVVGEKEEFEDRHTLVLVAVCRAIRIPTRETRSFDSNFRD